LVSCPLRRVPTGWDRARDRVEAKALRDARLGAQEMFELVIDSIIEGVQNAVAEHAAHSTPRPNEGIAT